MYWKLSGEIISSAKSQKLNVPQLWLLVSTNHPCMKAQGSSQHLPWQHGHKVEYQPGNNSKFKQPGKICANMHACMSVCKHFKIKSIV